MMPSRTRRVQNKANGGEYNWWQTLSQTTLTARGCLVYFLPLCILSIKIYDVFIKKKQNISETSVVNSQEVFLTVVDKSQTYPNRHDRIDMPAVVTTLKFLDIHGYLRFFLRDFSMLLRERFGCGCTSSRILRRKSAVPPNFRFCHNFTKFSRSITELFGNDGQN